MSLVVAFICLLGVASTSTAAPTTFSMVGEVRLVAGQLNLPVFPFPGLDVDGTTNYQMRGDPVGNCTDCIVVNTGVPAPPIVFPPGIFDAPAPVPFRGFPLPSVPSILNITTRIAFEIPDPAVGSVTIDQRATGADTFGWCPGGAGLTCTVSDPLRTDPNSPFVQYTAKPGGNRFGGVMQMFLQASGGPGSGGFVRRFAPNPAPPATVRLTLDPIGGSGYFGGGGPAGQTDFNPGAGNKPTIDAILTPGGFFVQTTVAVVSSPPNTNDRTDVDFPWTTGMITVLAPDAINPFARTITATGSDTRGSDGSGKLVMVSSGLNFGTVSGAWSTSIQTLRIITYTPEPGTWMAASAALLALGVGRSVARRKA